MKPIPVVFHLGPLQIHTYGIGLALTFWFAYWYYERRLRNNGYPTRWLAGAFAWIIVAAVVGARTVHVAAHASYYADNPGQVLAIWHGGLSSFGGLLFAVPTGIFLARRRCPELPIGRALDLVAPVLMASWALGRLLGPQLMVAGGGRPTTAWYGLEYAGQVGKRIPVPLFQAAECLVIFGILLLIERQFREGPTGMVVAAAAGLWGVDRFFDEYLYLAVPRLWDAVEVTAIVLALCGFGAMAVLWRRWTRAGRPPRQRPAAGDREAARPPVAAVAGPSPEEG